MLPDYTIVHKQDFFTETRWQPTPGAEPPTFLTRSFERHFNERPYLHHSCYLFITKTTKEQMRRQSTFSTLCRGFLVAQELRDADGVARFLDAVGQAESILRESGFIRLRRLTADEIVGTDTVRGLLHRYLTLDSESSVNEDLRLDAAHDGRR